MASLSGVRGGLATSRFPEPGPRFGPPLRYRCDVIARTVFDVVSGVGGRLVDLAMAGWQVTVVLADCSDALPLRILGASVVDLDWLAAGPGRARSRQVLMLAADVFASDDSVGRGAHCALGQGRAEVVVWGPSRGYLEAELGQSYSPTRYCVSAAGRAFKARALVAAGRPALFEPTEFYRTTAALGRHIHACI